MKSIISWIFILIIVICMTLGQDYAQQDKDIDEAIESFYWNSSQYQTIDDNNTGIQTTQNLVTKTIDWFGYSLFAVGRWSIGFGYEHEDIDYKYISELVIKILWIVMICIVIPVIPFLLAALYVLGVVIKKIYQKIKGEDHEH